MKGNARTKNIIKTELFPLLYLVIILTEIQQPVTKRLLKYNMGPTKTHVLTNAVCNARRKRSIECRMRHTPAGARHVKMACVTPRVCQFILVQFILVGSRHIV